MVNGSFHDELLSYHKTTIVSLTHRMDADKRGFGIYSFEDFDEWDRMGIRNL